MVWFRPQISFCFCILVSWGLTKQTNKSQNALGYVIVIDNYIVDLADRLANPVSILSQVKLPLKELTDKTGVSGKLFNRNMKDLQTVCFINAMLIV